MTNKDKKNRNTAYDWENWGLTEKEIKQRIKEIKLLNKNWKSLNSIYKSIIDMIWDIEWKIKNIDEIGWELTDETNELKKLKTNLNDIERNINNMNLKWIWDIEESIWKLINNAEDKTLNNIKIALKQKNKSRKSK